MYGGGVGYKPNFGKGSELDLFDPGNFSFTPDVYDPHLTVARNRAQLEGRRARESGINELSRAGLLGSSAGLDYMGNLEQDLYRNLENVDAQVFGRQRDFAERLYQMRLEEEMRKRREKEQRRQMLLGGLGKLAGLGLSGLFPTRLERGSSDTDLFNSENMGDYDAFLEEDMLRG